MTETTQGGDATSTLLHKSEVPSSSGATKVQSSVAPTPSIVTGHTIVPNFFPVADPSPYRIALIGEAPGEDERQYRIPFVGRSGQHLNAQLQTVGIDRNRVFLGNVCQIQPPSNEISRFDWNGPEISAGLRQLSDDLRTFKPHICVLLGNTPLHAAKFGSTPPPRRGKSINWPCKISSWCGSLFYSTVFQSKCISAFHPAGILRAWGDQGNFPRLQWALARALSEAHDPILSLPQRELRADLDCSSLCRLMDEWPSGLRCSVDIEGGLPNDSVNDGVRADSKKRRYIGWRCVALAGRATRSFAIPWWKFTELEMAALLRSFARLMARTDVPKVLQNALYDRFVLGYGYGIFVANVREDTMAKGWELYSELPKSLTVLASVYTREPHWKDEEMYESSGEALAIGCCKDTAVTLEICEALDSRLDARGRQHYEVNMRMENPALYMELRGINYDKENVAKKIKEIKETGWETTNSQGVPEWHESISRLGDRLGELAKCELRGPSGGLRDKFLATVMYSQLGYEPQFKKENGRLTNKLTTDIDALLKLRRKNPGDEFLSGVIRHRHLEGLLETLSIQSDPDGRVRCSYNVVGTETGRFSCKESPTGAGANMTTITKKLRSNYTADPDYDFFQCDLSGADGWTVAAHCARLGDRTMLDDYLYGLKPAKLIAGLHCFGGDFNGLDRDSLVYWSSKRPFGYISEAVGTGIYDCCKVVQHGSNYLMGIPTMQTNVMKKSFKESGTPIYMEHRDANALQSAYFTRYSGVKLWHTWAEAVLVSKGTLTSASGHTRVFFGRRFGKDIHDTLKEFLSDEPQQNTTFATNLAMLKLWEDKENRVVHVDKKHFTLTTAAGITHYWSGSLESFRRMIPGTLLIEPLHQVHDALCGQFPKFLKDWAIQRIKSYFDNALTIAGREITIPFEMGIGPSWGELK